MQKHIALLAILTAITAGAFAQDVSLDLRMSLHGNESGGHGYGREFLAFHWNITSQELQELQPNFFPALGIAIDAGPIEILADVSFWRTSRNWNPDPIQVSDASGNVYYLRGHITETLSHSYISLGFGVAPVIEAADRLRLIFPLMGTFSRHSIQFAYRQISPPLDLMMEEVSSSAINTFGLTLGARAIYSLNQRWGVFAGVQAAAFTFYGRAVSRGNRINDTLNEHDEVVRLRWRLTPSGETSMAFFHNARFDLGVRINF